MRWKYSALLLAHCGTAACLAQPYAEISSVPDNPAQPSLVFLPTLTIREAYTDNVRLQSHGEGDFLTSVTPGLVVQDKTAHFQLTFDGSVSYDAYGRASDLDGYRYTLFANGLAELVERTVLVDFRTAINVQPISLNGYGSALERVLPGNQDQVINGTISPYLAHDFGNWASGELRYRASALDYSAANGASQALSQTAPLVNQITPGSQDSNQISASLRAGPRFTIFRWVVEASASDGDYSGNQIVRQRSASATGEIALDRKLALIAIIGVDSFSDSADQSSNSLNGSGRLGVRLTPGPRTDLLLEGGVRYGGPYWTGQFRYHVSPALLFSASHFETVTTQQDLASNALTDLIRDDAGRLADPLTGDLSNPNQAAFNYSGQSFSLKSSRAELTGGAGRTSFSWTCEFDQRVNGVTSLGGSGSGGERQDALLLGASLTRQLTHRTNLTLSFSQAHNFDSLASGGYGILRAGATIDYRLATGWLASLGYRRYGLRNDIGPSYSENAAFASLGKNF
jgi:hypothetical protein